MIAIIVWLVIAAAALVGEVLTTSFFLIFFTVGAIAALISAAIPGIPMTVEIIVFLIVSALTMATLRPPLVRRLAHRNSQFYQLRDSVIGKRAVVTQAIEPDSTGTVRIGGGEYWTAEAVYSKATIPEGAQVEIVATRGVTALVDPVEQADILNAKRTV